MIREWRRAALTLLAGVLTATYNPTMSGSEAQVVRRPPSRPRPPITAAPGTERHLRGEDAVVRVYDFILDARFDQVDAELRRACGPAPAEACNVLDATATWWRILLDPTSRALDDEFSASVERAIRTTESWVERAPEEAEAWFYLGGAYGCRVQWRVLRNEKVAAARDGKRIKQAMERAIELDPGLDDAYFGIGLYKYYADVAPTAAKILRFLLLLPGGNREEGLEQMLRARNDGRLVQGEADYQLHLIYLWYEHQTPRAIELLRGLHQRYPGNPIFLRDIARIQDDYEHDPTASLSTWRTLQSMAREQRLNAAAMADTEAALAMAEHFETLYQTDHAIEQLQTIISAKPSAPYSSLALAWSRLGEAHDRLGARTAAIADYHAAAAAAPPDDLYEIRRTVADRLRHAPDVKRAEAYRLSLEGWRALERSDLPAATSALRRSLELNTRDGVAHYRYGRVLQARRDDALALIHFEQTVRMARECPPTVVAAAYLEAARLHERAGRRDQAIDWYRAAATLFGAAEETRNAASRALTRLQK